MGIAEFQAVVMAGGKGSRMTEITSGRPKCLLPIGNQPMVWYPLHMLERAGFHEAILIVLESVRTEVQTALDRCELKIHLDIVGIPAAGEDWGTADSLRFVSKKITSDVLVLSCDLVTDFDLQELLDLSRKHQASVTALFFPSAAEYAGVVPGPKSKNKPERDLVGIDPATSRLVFLRSASDFKETLALPRGLLRKHQRVRMHSRLADAHAYVLRQWVFRFLAHEKSFSTLKGELLPYIVKQQQLARPAKPSETDPNASLVAVDTKKDILQFAAESSLEAKVRSLSTYNDHSGDMRPVYLDDAIRCYGLVAPKTSFGLRANTLAAFCLANSKILDAWAGVTGGLPLARVHPAADVRSTQVDPRCMVGEAARLAEKTSFAGTMVGAHCQVEGKVRLAGCVLMPHVKVGEGCVLTNCVVCDEAEIGPGCELKDCLVGSHYVVPKGANPVPAENTKPFQRCPPSS